MDENKVVPPTPGLDTILVLKFDNAPPQDMRKTRQTSDLLSPYRSRTAWRCAGRRLSGADSGDVNNANVRSIYDLHNGSDGAHVVVGGI